jgi:tetratricopeptide (TPR) repeat protein
MLDVAVTRALSPEPEHRYKSAAELRAALEAALNEPSAVSPRRKLFVRGLASAIALSVIGVIAVGAARPDVRQKTLAALSPMIAKAEALQARAAARLHAAHPTPAEVAALKPEAPAIVSVEAKPEAAPLSTQAAPVGEAAPAPLAQAATANDDGEVDDDSPAAASAEKDAPAAKGANAEAEPAAMTVAATSSSSDDVIAEAHKLTAAGNKLKALNLVRHAAKKAPNDAQLLQELAGMAERDHAWGEAVRTARRLVSIDPSADSKLELARLERKTGHRARALELVRSVLKDTPDSPEAHAMLTQLGAAERVALQK